MRGAKLVAIDDLEGAAVDGLVRAAQSFDPSRGVPFKGFAAIVIKGHLLDLTIQHARPKYRPFFNAMPLTVELAEADSVQRWLPEPPQPDPLTDSTRRALQAALACLTPRQRQIICLHYFSDMNSREVSTELGLRYRSKSGGSASFTKFHALKKMRAALALRGITRLEHVL